MHIVAHFHLFIEIAAREQNLGSIVGVAEICAEVYHSADFEILILSYFYHIFRVYVS